MIAPLFNNSVHGDVLMRRDWIDTCLKYISPTEVKNVIDLVRAMTRQNEKRKEKRMSSRMDYRKACVLVVRLFVFWRFDDEQGVA